MSRSRKKVPVIGIACHQAKTHKFFKKDMQAKTRIWLDSQGDDVVPDGAMYKKLMHSWVWRPDDGKQWYEDPKSYRK